MSLFPCFRPDVGFVILDGRSLIPKPRCGQLVGSGFRRRGWLHGRRPLLAGFKKRSIEPSRNALVLLEAGALQLPVVASRVGGVLELVEHGVTGSLVPSEDPNSLAAEMERLLTDPEHSDRLAGCAYERVRHRFRWERSCEEYLGVIEERSPVLPVRPAA